MSVDNVHYKRPAGPDTSLRAVHETGQDGISYLSVPKMFTKRPPTPANRRPLGDRTRDLNIVSTERSAFDPWTRV